MPTTPPDPDAVLQRAREKVRRYDEVCAKYEGRWSHEHTMAEREEIGELGAIRWEAVDLLRDLVQLVEGDVYREALVRLQGCDDQMFVDLVDEALRDADAKAGRTP